MPSILIDYKNFGNVEKKDGYESGVVMDLDNDTYKKLNGLPLGKERIDYFESDEFKKGIISKSYIFYNENKNICVIEDIDDLNNILLACKSLPTNTIFWGSVGVDDEKKDEKIKMLIDKGFSTPYITEHNPLKMKIDPVIAMVKNNGEYLDKKSIHNKVMDVLKNFRNSKKCFENDVCISTCYLTVQFSSDALKFLRSLSLKDFGKKTQKEHSGELVVKQIVDQDNSIIYKINVDYNTLLEGGEENVDVSGSRYNFHSHPKDAYIRHSVSRGWPSSTDFIGFKMLDNTILHCVATLEGLYVLSFVIRKNPISKISNKFIDDKFDIDDKPSMTIEKYLKKVNNIKHRGEPIFNVQFFPWEEAGKPFTIYYPVIGMACMATQKTVETFRMIHK